MLKNLFHDIVITIIVLASMWGIGQVPLFKNLEVLNPIAEATQDFDMTDVVFSKLRLDPKGDDRITLVNIGELGREGIAILLDSIQQYQPKVIGIDVFFRSELDPVIDSMFEATCARIKNLVFVTQLAKPNEKASFDSLETSNERFVKHGHGGFANLTTEGAGNQTGFYTCRSFIPQATVKDAGIQYSFGLKIAELYDAQAAKKLLDRKQTFEDINFRGNINVEQVNLGEVEGKQGSVFTAVDFDDIFEGRFDGQGVFKGRIVILGYLGSQLGQISFDDKFYTPLNDNYVDKRTPDMYGVVIHANIVSMILDANYINQASPWLEYSLMLLITLLSAALFSFFFRKVGYWYDALTILCQLILSTLIVAIGLYAFVTYNLKISINFTILIVFVIGIFIEIYFGLILKLINKEKQQK